MPFWFSSQFLLYPYSGSLSGRSLLLLPIIFIVLLIGSVLARWQARRAIDRAGADWWRLVAAWQIGLAVPGFVLIFFAWQRVPYLSMRLLLALNLLAILVVAGWMSWYWFKLVPRRRAGVQRRREYTKYLPK
jgi:hypothetical protein